MIQISNLTKSYGKQAKDLQGLDPSQLAVMMPVKREDATPAPAEKPLPLPVSTIAFTPGEPSALSRALINPARSAAPSPLTGGLIIVITATLPRFS